MTRWRVALLAIAEVSCGDEEVVVNDELNRTATRGGEAGTRARAAYLKDVWRGVERLERVCLVFHDHHCVLHPSLPTVCGMAPAEDVIYVSPPPPHIPVDPAVPPLQLKLTEAQQKQYDEVLEHFSKEGYELPEVENGTLTEEEKFWLVRLQEQPGYAC